jgi:hypothetical protein
MAEIGNRLHGYVLHATTLHYTAGGSNLPGFPNWAALPMTVPLRLQYWNYVREQLIVSFFLEEQKSFIGSNNETMVNFPG